MVTYVKNPLKNLPACPTLCGAGRLHKLKRLKFTCFSLENLFIAQLLTAFPALIRQILILFSSHIRFIKGFVKQITLECCRQHYRHNTLWKVTPLYLHASLFRSEDFPCYHKSDLHMDQTLQDLPSAFFRIG